MTECCSGLGLSKEAVRVDYLLGFPLLPPEPLLSGSEVRFQNVATEPTVGPRQPWHDIHCRFLNSSVLIHENC